MQYYWETMKVDISKILLSDENNPEKAKGISCKIFAIPEEVRNMFITKYCQYCRIVFVFKFTLWRLQKLKYYSLPIHFNWHIEIPLMKKQIRQLS